ncbi:hypothetical protein UB32_05465 [Mesobacillus subterraneus]|uniref:Uncharacterized protein n=1 Tax=Mesobacillus subterraneus TaxID=285983 RepID=A0A0D6ZBP7_9BACI|nr:hypothetical protein UB32_05465 [Mesobacillus subterraneus]
MSIDIKEYLTGPADLILPGKLSNFPAFLLFVGQVNAEQPAVNQFVKFPVWQSSSYRRATLVGAEQGTFAFLA